MANTLVVTEIVFDRFPELRGELRRRVNVAVRKAALDIQGHAAMIVPVVTGNLKNSIRMEMESDVSAIVGTHVHYAPYVEFGTRRMRAKPYLGPAAEKVRPSFMAAMRELLNE